jgi:polar amino acid transport system permease protein
MPSRPLVVPPAPHERLVRAGVSIALLGAFVLFLALRGPKDGWAWSQVWGDAERPRWRPVFLAALFTTLRASAMALVIALVVGFAAGLARISSRVWLSQIAATYVELVRGTPLVVQLFVAVYCVQYSLGLDNPFVVGSLTLGLFAGAYVSEIVRSAIQSVDPGQMEAALSQGMTRGQALRRVILPQSVRRMLPPMAGEFVSLVKDSSLLMTVGVLELSKRAKEAQGDTYRTYEIYLPLAVLYLAITFPLSRWVRRLELRSAAP